MIHHNPRIPLFGSFFLLLAAIVGLFLKGLWYVVAFALFVAIQLALLFQSQARIEDDVNELEADVRGILDRERDRHPPTEDRP